MRDWKMGLLALSAVTAAGAIGGGCDVDVTTESEWNDEGPTGSVSQAEVTSCPGFAAQIPNVKYDKELVITNTAVVDDPCRTIFDNPLCSDPNKTTINGKWSFWYLMSQVAGSGQNTSRFILKWLETFEDSTIVVNNQTLQGRSKIRSLIIDPWRSASGCEPGKKYDDVGGACTLNKTRAPFRLLAILNRVDLRAGGPGSVDPYGQIVSGGDAGEGRFVFGFTNVASSDATVAGTPPLLEAAMILEYKLPTQNRTAKQWALDWRGLGGSTSFDANYKTALQTITERFAKTGVNPGGLNNGSAISQVRSDERQFDPALVAGKKVWSMREFKLCPKGQTCSGNTRLLTNDTTAQTPPTKLALPNPTSSDMNNTTFLDHFLDNNQTAIQNGQHVVPNTFEGQNFLAGESRAPAAPSGVQWNRSDENELFDPITFEPTLKCSTRRLMAFSTCNGCHYLETGTGQNLHIPNRSTGSETALSNFLTQQINPGTDPCETNVTAITYDEPKRRKCELLALAGGASAPITTVAGRPH